MDILSYVTAFGLASGAGGRAALVVFALGLFHHTEYFTLSESFLWVGSLPVMAVLGVLALVEILADLHPDISELQDVAGYLPAVVAGFIAFAATTGDVDSSVLHLAASGVMGGAAAASTRFCRNQLSSVVREISAGSSEKVHSLRSHGETGFVVALTASAFFWPVLVAGFLLLVGGMFFWVRRRKQSKAAEHVA